jgi:hypothetical protein
MGAKSAAITAFKKGRRRQSVKEIEETMSDDVTLVTLRADEDTKV